MKAGITLLLALYRCVESIPIESTQASLDEMASSCGLQKDALCLQSDGYIRFRPGPKAKFEAIDCAMKKVVASGLKNKIGFVGNEASEPEKK